MSNVASGCKPREPDGIRVRHARRAREAVVLLSRRGDVWQADLADISATGVRLVRPAGWHGEPGDVWVLDVLVGASIDIHMMAELVRVAATDIAFAFTRIAEGAGQALWTLLGGYADRTEP